MAKQDLSTSAFPGKKAEITQFESIDYWPKISVNRHQLVLCLEEADKVAASVVHKYINPTLTWNRRLALTGSRTSDPLILLCLLIY